MRDFWKWNWIHSCKQVFVKSYELNYWYQELGGKFTVFLEIKKSEIKNQNRKKDNSHIIGNRKAKSGNPKAKSEKKTTSLKSEKRKAKIFSESPNQSISFARGWISTFISWNYFHQKGCILSFLTHIRMSFYLKNSLRYVHLKSCSETYMGFKFWLHDI